MIAQLTDYCSDVLAYTINKWASVYVTDSGKTILVRTTEGYTDQPMVLPEIFVWTPLPRDFRTNLIGGSSSYDPTLGIGRAIVQEDVRVHFGIRASSHVERSRLIDLLALNLTLGVDPATQNRFAQDLWSTFGLNVYGISDCMGAESDTSAWGRVYEFTGMIDLTAEVKAVYSYPLVTQISVQPIPLPDSLTYNPPQIQPPPPLA